MSGQIDALLVGDSRKLCQRMDLLIEAAWVTFAALGVYVREFIEDSDIAQQRGQQSP